MPSVDVVIPCYNYARYLPQCVDSVLSQTGVDVRALIIDDTSTDDTPEVAADLVRRDSRVEYRRHAKNMRHIATYNEGLLDWASADYSLLLSADDLLSPGSLRRATSVMEENPHVHMTYGMALLFVEDDEIAARPQVAGISLQVGTSYRLVSGPTFIRQSIAGNPVPTPTALVRTSVQQSIGGYAQNLPHTADMEMWMRFASQGSIGVVPNVQAYKRTHTTNMSIAYADRPMGDARERVEACDEILSRYGAKLGPEAPTMTEVRKTIATQVFWTASGALGAGHAHACQEALSYAAEIWPEIRKTAPWRRLRLKQALSPFLLKVLSPLIHPSNRSNSRGELTSDEHVGRVRQIGWWPA